MGVWLRCAKVQVPVGGGGKDGKPLHFFNLRLKRCLVRFWFPVFGAEKAAVSEGAVGTVKWGDIDQVCQFKKGNIIAPAKMLL